MLWSFSSVKNKILIFTETVVCWIFYSTFLSDVFDPILKQFNFREAIAYMIANRFACSFF